MRTDLCGRQRAFTLLEVLVVLGIIGVLLALALPAVASFRSRANDAVIAGEISRLREALWAYKRDKGDFPPSMGEDYSPANRFRTICERHLRTCYPHLTPQAKAYFYDYIAPELDQDEAIVFWLSLTTTDPRDPFPVAMINGNPIPKPSAAAPRRVYFEFQEDRLWDTPDDPDGFPAYQPPYCKGTTYVHIDARYYLYHLTPQTAAIRAAQPYFDGAGRPINPGTFQIITAGQDGDYGALWNAAADPTKLKRFPVGENYAEGDRDNLTDFSSGRRLAAFLP
jgi:prepilin-type N-terminal cleavage/methylation domain-containing protein